MIGLSQAGVEFGIQPGAISSRNLELGLVGNQLYHVAGTIQHGRTMLAHFEMRFHARSQFRIEGVIDKIRDFSPNFDAANFNHHRVDADQGKLLQLN
jgi:hypothetical protein